MTYLSENLARFYTRKPGRVVFNNTISLNQLALKMWDVLSPNYIDASVISRVINGERLFTPAQLRAFCEALELGRNAENSLFFALGKDYLQQAGMESDVLIVISTADALEHIEKLLKDATQLLYDGECANLARLCSIAEGFAEKISSNFLTDAQQKLLDEAIAWNLYLEGRAIGSYSMRSNVLQDLLPVIERLQKLHRTHGLASASAYAYLLLTNAHYIAGGYSGAQNKRGHYKKAISSGRNALALLDPNHKERLFALRTMLASAIYMNDKDAMTSLQEFGTQLIVRQEPENRVNALHLAGTISRAAALKGDPHPFAIRDITIQQYGGSLSDGGIYELSDRKTYAETLLALKTSDTYLIRANIQRGLQIAYQGNFYRYRYFLEKLLVRV